MTKKDKELLLKDLYARIPYGVIVCQVLDDGSYSGCHDVLSVSDLEDLDSVRPYLRPIESITEEEYKELTEVYNHGETHHVVLPQNDERHHATLCMISNGTIDDWLNAHHFDYRGLIPKGLALEAKEGMYKIKD